MSVVLLMMPATLFIVLRFSSILRLFSTIHSLISLSSKIFKKYNQITIGDHYVKSITFFFSPGATTPNYSPLVGFSLLACEVS